MPASINKFIRKIDILHILMILSFVIWIGVFRGFVFNQLVLTGDALPYFNHFKYFIDHLMKGIYPMWDPFISGGVPNEFFLRRIGSFNPFYLVMILFRWVGLPFALAYLFFLAFYYWFGMIGFYLLSLKIYKHRLCAFIAYLLLMFSSMSTVLFSSFLILSVVPIIWFFYFFVSFFEKCERWTFLGMIFALMIIFTTYLPFYFLHNFILCLICLVVIFPLHFLKSFKNMAFFIWQNRFFSFLSIICLCAALSAGFLFFKEMASGELVMSIRHKDTDTLNTLMVAPQTYIDGGIMATTLADEQFNHFDRFILGRFYIPIIFCVYLLLGLIVQINKRILFLLCWAFLALISGVYEASPVYRFLYDHVVYIKYMRNFQYFLWINLLPVLILLAVENLNLFMKKDWKSRINKWSIIFTVVIIHLGLMGFFVLNKSSAILPGSILLSLLFFYLVMKGEMIEKSRRVLILLFVLILLHPIEVFTFLTKNSDRKIERYNYELWYIDEFKMLLPDKIEYKEEVLDDKEIDKILEIKEWPALYWFALRSYLNFRTFVAPKAFDLNQLTKLQLFEQVYRIDYEHPDYEIINRVMLKRDSKAFIPLSSPIGETEIKKMEKPHKLNVKNTFIWLDSKDVIVHQFQPNKVELKCEFPDDKFLIYNDNYEKRWEVFIDGKKEVLYQANLTFKGVWVPAGKHAVVFKYGAGFYEFYNKFLMFIFYVVFAYLIFLAFHRFNLRIVSI